MDSFSLHLYEEHCFMTLVKPTTNFSVSSAKVLIRPKPFGMSG